MTLTVVLLICAFANVLHITFIESRYRRIAENIRDQRMQGEYIGRCVRDLDR